MTDKTQSWTRKDLLGLRELSAEEIHFVLETADAFKQVGTREVKKVPALQGKTLVNLFIEPSTRTRISFELAAKRLSADIVNITAAASSLTKGETLKGHGQSPRSQPRRYHRSTASLCLAPLNFWPAA
jgi:aspartate carbamoyltransferase catalytic subunit